MGRAKSARRASALGQYILGKTIGEGTFGKVKLGTHVLTGEKVAVKILERARVQEVADVERVAREIHILKLVRHPHIIRLYEIIQTPQQLYLIMEYCSGGELFDHIVECGKVPEKDACVFIHQILSGVELIHKNLVVHRDLKPENLLLDGHGNIRIADFGLGNIFKEGQLLKTACGSPCYASPEMIAGHHYVPSRCDIWSCGVILFALICGYLPFEDQNTAVLYRKILHAEYTIPKFISADARDLICGMLTIDPEQRLTIPEIKEHPWYLQIPCAAKPFDSGSGKDIVVDAEVLSQLEELGFDRHEAEARLRSNRYDDATTAYYLLCERKRGALDRRLVERRKAKPEEGAEARPLARQPKGKGAGTKGFEGGDQPRSGGACAASAPAARTGPRDGAWRRQRRGGRPERPRRVWRPVARESPGHEADVPGRGGHGGR